MTQYTDQATEVIEDGKDIAEKVASAVRLSHGEKAANYVLDIALAFWSGGMPILTEDELMSECAKALDSGKFDDLENRMESIGVMTDAHWNYVNGYTSIDGEPNEHYIQLADDQIVVEGIAHKYK